MFGWIAFFFLMLLTFVWLSSFWGLKRQWRARGFDVARVRRVAAGGAIVSFIALGLFRTLESNDTQGTSPSRVCGTGFTQAGVCRKSPRRGEKSAESARTGLYRGLSGALTTEGTRAQFRELLWRMPKIADWLAERSEFELADDFINGQ